MCTRDIYIYITASDSRLKEDAIVYLGHELVGVMLKTISGTRSGDTMTRCDTVCEKCLQYFFHVSLR